MGGLLGAAGAAEGAGAAGGAQTGAGVAAAGGATATGGLGSAAASGLANSAAQGAAMQTLNPQALSALGEGFQSGLMQSMYGNQWQGGPLAQSASLGGGQAAPVAPMETMAPNIAQEWQAPPMDASGFNMAQRSTGIPSIQPQSPGATFGAYLKNMISQKFKRPSIGGGGGGQAPQHTQDMIAQILAMVMKGGMNGTA